MNQEATAFDHGEIDFMLQIGKPAREPSTASTPMGIGACRGCHADLQWAAPEAGEWAFPKACPQCSRVYFVRDPSYEKGSCCDLSVLAHIPRPEAQCSRAAAATISELFESLFGSDCQVEERRSTVRYNHSIPIVGVPLDDLGRPVSEAIGLTLENLSWGGAGLQRNGDIPSRRLLLDFTLTGCSGFQLAADISWERRKNETVRIGAEFLLPLDEALQVRAV